ncbi:nucleotide exchange factor GrpE [Candidatus Bathyarchaeota archaeon]|nr:nucleotide exchange factor GrpE [Candidatus Bathyarchaeota archaeon]
MSSSHKKNEINVSVESKYKQKVAKLEASLKEKTQLEETYLNQLKYAQADLENLQKHVQKRITESVTREKMKLITQILTIAEEADIVLKEAKKEKNSILLEGMEMVNKKLWKIITCEGLCPITAIGKPFDPNVHEAIQEIETCDYPEGMVIEEIKKGYLLNGKVFRPCLVKVTCSSRLQKIKSGNEL